MGSLVQPVTNVGLRPFDRQHLVERLRMTLAALVAFALFPLAIVLFVLNLLLVPLGLLGVGFALAHVVVPLTESLTRLHRRLSGTLLGEPVPTGYAPTGTGFFGPPLVWVRDAHRWRDVGFLAYAGTGGVLMSGFVVLALVTPLAHLVMAFTIGGWMIATFLVALVISPPIWWAVTPPLVLARAQLERSILGRSRAEMKARIQHVEVTRADTLDASAAEIRRIERDLHDGAQARIAALGMSVGLAEKLVETDPDAATALLREARESTVDALADLRSVIRGIHPPALADRGLAGAIEALAVPIPLPITVGVAAPDLPAPVQSAAYFAVAECLTNVTKHAAAKRAWVQGSHDGDRLRIMVGDDGRGGADPTGSGLSGVARRLSAFDGTISIESPPGGPTLVTMEIACPSNR